MKLCIALDMPTKQQNIALVHEIKSHFPHEEIWLKVGLSSFIRDGKNFIYSLQNLGFRIFLDLKLYDIPNTMIHAIKECQNLGVDMITIHASCGMEAMREIMQYNDKTRFSTSIIAVSALTSFDNNGFQQIYNVPLQYGIRQFAKFIYQCNIHGLVCSIQDLPIVKEVSTSLFTVTPGIRLQKSQDDQKRVATVKKAKNLGSDMIVVGRPIYNAINKKEIIQQILLDMQY